MSSLWNRPQMIIYEFGITLCAVSTRDWYLFIIISGVSSTMLFVPTARARYSGSFWPLSFGSSNSISSIVAPGYVNTAVLPLAPIVVPSGPLNVLVVESPQTHNFAPFVGWLLMLFFTNCGVGACWGRKIGGGCVLGGEGIGLVK